MFLTINQLPIADNHVIVRTDLNIPLHGNQISQHRKFKALLTTISKLQDQMTKQITIITHLGRPTKSSTEFSTKQFVPFFRKAGLDVAFIKTPEENTNASIQILENVRFFEEETTKNCTSFADRLKTLGDVFVQDAFGVVHRNNCSTTTLAQQFAPEHRGIGVLTQSEIAQLTGLKQSTDQPFVLVLGGSKIATKVGMLETFITLPNNQRPSTIVLVGLLPLAFLDQNLVPESQKVSQEALDQATQIMELAADHNVDIVLPTDFVFDDAGSIVDFGNESLAVIDAVLKTAKKVFMNGTIGYYEDPRFEKGTKQVLTTISKLYGALCVAGGGDASAAIDQYGLGDGFDFVSTGGGATLAFLAADKPETELPGLAALL